MRHIYTLVSKLTLPIRPHAHILRSCHCDDECHLTLGVKALDPYITTQVNGILTIARRMDDENKNPRVSTYLAT